MKRTTIIATMAIVGIIAISTLSFAGPRSGGRGGSGDCPRFDRNPAVAQLTQEKRDLLQNILEEHRKAVQPLHDGMWEKRTLLQALSINPNAKPEAISALVHEMNQLRTQLRDQRDALETRVEKEVGIDLPGRFGRGGDHRGMGGHFRDGRGNHRGAGCGMGNGSEDFAPRGMGRGMGYGPGDGSCNQGS
jgi:zinc resistance-associated protein